MPSNFGILPLISSEHTQSYPREKEQEYQTRDETEDNGQRHGDNRAAQKTLLVDRTLLDLLTQKNDLLFLFVFVQSLLHVNHYIMILRMLY